MEEYQWQAIVSCDASYNGQFYYGVATTKIFCRPSCKSRAPKKENTKIFMSWKEAMDSGFRPCKRCRPTESSWQEADDDIVDWTIDFIEKRYNEAITLSDIAESIPINPYHLHRRFKRKVGISPIEYLSRKRMEVAKKMLQQSDMSVTDIALTVGFSSISHFSSVFHEKTGYTPTEYGNM